MKAYYYQIFLVFINVFLFQDFLIFQMKPLFELPLFKFLEPLFLLLIDLPAQCFDLLQSFHVEFAAAFNNTRR